MIATNTRVQVASHPLVQQCLLRLRDYETPTGEFRQQAAELGRFLVYEAMRDLSVREVSVETPVGPGKGTTISDYVILAPVLRAGLALGEVAHHILPNARVFHVGLKRDEETLKAIPYYNKLPDTLPTDCRVYILDPMLATGGSAAAAISLFDKMNIKNIHFICFVAAPEGIARVHDEFPHVVITTASVDSGLNEKGYIVPGLGDAGDRIFGT